jgi:chemotaxis family two-component system sensor kinase Cph1
MNQTPASPAGLDRSLCEQQPIHTPGAIQPRGALVAASADGLRITHASLNLATFLGYAPEAVLGQPLEALIGESACRVLRASVSDADALLGPLSGLAATDGSSLHLHAFRSGRHIGIDIERISAGPTSGSLATAARSVLETFRHATGSAELLDRAVRGLKTLLGYDRVIAYRFHEDHHGEVIAEAREDPLEPYLGLHYPAGDIPTQARALYLRRRVGEIPDACYQPVPLLAETTPGVDHALDLTHSARAASPGPIRSTCAT